MQDFNVQIPYFILLYVLPLIDTPLLKDGNYSNPGYLGLIKKWYLCISIAPAQGTLIW
jgi:hypothetical protein